MFLVVCYVCFVLYFLLFLLFFVLDLWFLFLFCLAFFAGPPEGARRESSKDGKVANKRWKGVISGKKYFRWFAVNTCPLGQVLAGPDMSDFRLLVEFRTFRVQNLVFSRNL